MSPINQLRMLHLYYEDVDEIQDIAEDECLPIQKRLALCRKVLAKRGLRDVSQN